MKSLIRKVGPVTFPEFTGERVYMVPFFQGTGLPDGLVRWQATVDAMLQGTRTERPIYLMIDQAQVSPGNTHRRGGPHIDGNWIAEVGAHVARPIHGPKPSPPAPTWGTGGGSWNCGSHGHRGSVRNGLWMASDFSPEALILASDVSACMAYEGEAEGNPLAGGSCEHLDIGGMLPHRLEAGIAYSGNVTMVHESLPVSQACRRTLVRLNVPGIEI